jgi:predicted HD superfamily hydrolase involved in NAD metabolism
MDYAELSALLDARLPTMLSPARVGHSRRVAALAAELCAREGLDPAAGRAAGLAHDLCKELPAKKVAALAELYPPSRSVSALMADKVAHGPAAAALVAREYGVADREFLEAVALHTIGDPSMGRLAAIVYCADKLEPGRERIDEDYRRRCLALPIEALLLEVVRGSVEWMRAKGKAVAPETLVLYSSLAARAVPDAAHIDR